MSECGMCVTTHTQHTTHKESIVRKMIRQKRRDQKTEEHTALTASSFLTHTLLIARSRTAADPTTRHREAHRDMHDANITHSEHRGYG